jgi:hypothetical protein
MRRRRRRRGRREGKNERKERDDTGRCSPRKGRNSPSQTRNWHSHYNTGRHLVCFVTILYYIIIYSIVSIQYRQDELSIHSLSTFVNMNSLHPGQIIIYSIQSYDISIPRYRLVTASLRGHTQASLGASESHPYQVSLAKITLHFFVYRRSSHTLFLYRLTNT